MHVALAEESSPEEVRPTRCCSTSRPTHGVESIICSETYLKGYEGALVITSHDRGSWADHPQESPDRRRRDHHLPDATEFTDLARRSQRNHAEAQFDRRHDARFLKEELSSPFKARANTPRRRAG
jgi:ATPase subunit of ABC transporter with duplicated ATPase domains